MRTRVAVTVEQAWHRVPGGTASSVLRTLQAATGLDDDVDLVGVAAAHRAAPRDWPVPVPVRHLPLPRQLLYPAWQRLRLPPVEVATGPVDVVHATTFAVPPATRPLVVTVHDLAFLHDPDHYTARGNAFFRRGLALTRRHAALVLVPSEQTRRECLDAGLPDERLRVVPWGVAPAAPPPDADARRRRLGLARPYLLWTGTIEPRKNLPTLLTAWDRLRRAHDPDLDLVLVGPVGWGGVADRLPGADDRVHVLGRVAQDDLESLYAGARAFCLPSLREGFGMPVLEAMAHGTPVVTSTGTPMADLVGEGGLAVDALDAEALADALRRVAGAERDDRSAAARAAASGRTWGATARATLDAYADAARG